MFFVLVFWAVQKCLILPRVNSVVAGLCFSWHLFIINISLNGISQNVVAPCSWHGEAHRVWFKLKALLSASW